MDSDAHQSYEWRCLKPAETDRPNLLRGKKLAMERVLKVKLIRLAALARRNRQEQEVSAGTAAADNDTLLQEAEQGMPSTVLPCPSKAERSVIERLGLRPISASKARVQAGAGFQTPTSHRLPAPGLTACKRQEQCCTTPSSDIPSNFPDSQPNPGHRDTPRPEQRAVLPARCQPDPDGQKRGPGRYVPLLLSEQSAPGQQGNAVQPAEHSQAHSFPTEQEQDRADRPSAWLPEAAGNPNKQAERGPKLPKGLIQRRAVARTRESAGKRADKGKSQGDLGGPTKRSRELPAANLRSTTAADQANEQSIIGERPPSPQWQVRKTSKATAVRARLKPAPPETRFKPAGLFNRDINTRPISAGQAAGHAKVWGSKSPPPRLRSAAAAACIPDTPDSQPPACRIMPHTRLPGLVKQHSQPKLCLNTLLGTLEGQSRGNAGSRKRGKACAQGLLPESSLQIQMAAKRSHVTKATADHQEARCQAANADSQLQDAAPQINKQTNEQDSEGGGAVFDRAREPQCRPPQQGSQGKQSNAFRTTIAASLGRHSQPESSPGPGKKRGQVGHEGLDETPSDLEPTNADGLSMGPGIGKVLGHATTMEPFSAAGQLTEHRSEELDAEHQPASRLDMRQAIAGSAADQAPAERPKMTLSHVEPALTAKEPPATETAGGPVRVAHTLHTPLRHTVVGRMNDFGTFVADTPAQAEDRDSAESDADDRSSDSMGPSSAGWATCIAETPAELKSSRELPSQAPLHYTDDKATGEYQRLLQAAGHFCVTEEPTAARGRDSGSIREGDGDAAITMQAAHAQEEHQNASAGDKESSDFATKQSKASAQRPGVLPPEAAGVSQHAGMFQNSSQWSQEQQQSAALHEDSCRGRALCSDASGAGMPSALAPAVHATEQDLLDLGLLTPPVHRVPRNDGAGSRIESHAEVAFQQGAGCESIPEPQGLLLECSATVHAAAASPCGRLVAVCASSDRPQQWDLQVWRLPDMAASTAPCMMHQCSIPVEPATPRQFLQLSRIGEDRHLFCKLWGSQEPGASCSFSVKEIDCAPQHAWQSSDLPFAVHCLLAARGKPTIFLAGTGLQLIAYNLDLRENATAILLPGKPFSRSEKKLGALPAVLELAESSYGQLLGLLSDGGLALWSCHTRALIAVQQHPSCRLQQAIPVDCQPGMLPSASALPLLLLGQQGLPGCDAAAAKQGLMLAGVISKRGLDVVVVTAPQDVAMLTTYRRTIAAASANGQIRLWDMGQEAPVKLVDTLQGSKVIWLCLQPVPEGSNLILQALTSDGMLVCCQIKQ